MIAINDNKSMHQQQMDYLTNDCHIRMFIEEARYVLESCGRKCWGWR